MYISIKNIIYSKIITRALALIIAYCVWNVFSKNTILNKIITVPVYFYNSDNIKIESPKELMIKLRGFRRNINSIDLKNLAIFIDSKNYTTGTHPLIITSKNLFLPENIDTSIVSPQYNFIKIN